MIASGTLKVGIVLNVLFSVILASFSLREVASRIENFSKVTARFTESRALILFPMKGFVSKILKEISNSKRFRSFIPRDLKVIHPQSREFELQLLY
jgi:hypothetical protein